MSLHLHVYTVLFPCPGHCSEYMYIIIYVDNKLWKLSRWGLNWYGMKLTPYYYVMIVKRRYNLQHCIWKVKKVECRLELRGQRPEVRPGHSERFPTVVEASWRRAWSLGWCPNTASSHCRCPPGSLREAPFCNLSPHVLLHLLWALWGREVCRRSRAPIARCQNSTRLIL